MKMILTILLTSFVTIFLLSFNYNQGPLFNLCYQWFGPSAKYVQNQLGIMAKNTVRESKSFGKKLIENGQPPLRVKTKATSEDINPREEEELNQLIREY